MVAIAWLLVLWAAGGASRADAAGQIVVRGFAWLTLAGLAATAYRLDWRAAKGPWIVFALTVTMVAIQLVPLPPSVWTALPGRSLLADTATVIGSPPAWHPLSISPSLTYNALASLVVPGLTLVILTLTGTHSSYKIVPAILILLSISCVIGVAQFGNVAPDNPLINELPGAVSGTFANRNHFALACAIGCLLILVWGLHWSSNVAAVPLAFVGLLNFWLMILISGSRSGLVLAVIGTVGGAIICWSDLKRLRALGDKRRNTVLAATAGLVAVGVIGLIILRGQAATISRLSDLSAGEDLRVTNQPVVLQMIADYFPFGIGFGAFDPAFRIHEPYQSLGLQYYNHAHSDLIEVLIEGGIVSSAILVGAIAWLATRMIAIWRPSSRQTVLGKVGTIMLLLIILASATDYPARTPLMMALVALGAVWASPATGLGSRTNRRGVAKDGNSKPALA